MTIKESIEKIIPILILISLLSILFFPINQISKIIYPIGFAVLLALIYWILKK
jgi:hypothetical protein